MTKRVDLTLYAARPMGRSPVVNRRGEPAGAPPMPWRKWILSLFGFPVRLRRAVDECVWLDPPEWPEDTEPQ